MILEILQLRGLRSADSVLDAALRAESPTPEEHPQCRLSWMPFGFTPVFR